jgi:hypothetical protein
MDSIPPPAPTLKCQHCEAPVEHEGLCANCVRMQQAVIDLNEAQPPLHPARHIQLAADVPSDVESEFPDLEPLRQELARLGRELIELNSEYRPALESGDATGVRSPRFAMMVSVAAFLVGFVAGISTIAAMSSGR